MAPRRRAQQTEDARTAGLQDRRCWPGGHAQSEDEDEDESASPLNMLAICVQYADLTEKKNKAKADKAVAEAKKIVSDFATNIQAVIDAEQRDIQAAYEAYRSDSQRDMQEKEDVLLKLLKNFEDIQRLAKTLHERHARFEGRRHVKTEQCFKIAEEHRAASAHRVNQALASKREGVHTRV